MNTKNHTNISAVVVTYNRLELLKENISALKNQTYPINKIILVNNNSTDGTTDYINKTFVKDGLFNIINLEKNIGGAGGFYEGIKEAVKIGSDWVWIMDDDTVPTPTALEKLVNKINIVKNTGFLGSSVLFTDGTPHLMNNVPPSTNNILNIQWNAFAEKKILAVSFLSFVSCLISTQVIEKIGLPYKDFFIWGDDKEYTERIIHAKYFGGLVLDSIVYHKTKNNYAVDLMTANDSLAWKYFYGERNRIFIEKKQRSKINFLLWYLLDLLRTSKKLKKIKGNKILKKSIRKGIRRGLFFSPKIDFL